MNENGKNLFQNKYMMVNKMYNRNFSDDIKIWDDFFV